MDELIDWLVEALAPFSLWRLAARLRNDLAGWCDIRMTSPLAALAGLNCIGALILMRASGPGPAFRMSDSRLCLAAAAAAALAVAIRWALSSCQRKAPAFWIKALLAAFSVLPLAALFVTASPRNSLVAVSFVGALAVVAGNANLLWKRKLNLYAATFGEFDQPNHDKPIPARDVIVTPIRSPAGSFAIKDRARPQATDWLERTTDESGNAVVHGCVIARFEAGQSLATAHIPFQPPFDRVPEFTCEAVHEPGVRVRSPAVFRYGARLEVKRSAAGLPLELPLPFHAVARERSLRAA
ncbi:MAG: hypothetical protein HY290_12895 [Planctomycetia bacterium]|nr:hypothetical protein [Planctomycetia bacterium]